MTCQCRYEFCWLCMGPWSEHGQNTGGYYKCNKFTDKRNKGEYNNVRDEKMKSQVQLQRYQMYIERFIEHKKALKYAQKKRKELLSIVKELRKHPEASQYNLDCLEIAGRIIVEARLAIAYSYPLAFFLKNIKKLNFYEFAQSELERNLEVIDGKTDFKSKLIVGKKLVGNLK